MRGHWGDTGHKTNIEVREGVIIVVQGIKMHRLAMDGDMLEVQSYALRFQF